MQDNLKKFKEYSRGKQAVFIRVSDKDIFDNTYIFKGPKGHEDYIRWRFFNEHKLRVSRFAHEYKSDTEVAKWGLVFEMEDTVLQTIVRITGIVGESLEPVALKDESDE